MSDIPPSAAGGVASILRLYKALWTYAEGRRLRLLAAVLLLLLSHVAALGIPYWTGQAVTVLQHSHGKDLLGAAETLSVAVSMVVLMWLPRVPGRLLERAVAAHAARGLADALYAKAASLPLEWHDARPTGATTNRVSRSTAALQAFGEAQWILAAELVGILGPMIVLFCLSWETALAAAVGWLVWLRLLVGFDARLLPIYERENAAERRWQSFLFEALAHLPTIRALRAAEPVRSRLRGRRQAQGSLGDQAAVLGEAKWAVLDLYNALLSTAIPLLFAFLSWKATGAVRLGVAVMVFQYAAQIASAARDTALSWAPRIRQASDLAAADEILHAVSEPPAPLDVPSDWREIEVRGLSFSYAGSGIQALDGIDAKIRRGARVALVGTSGSGKSSFLRSLAGLYHPSGVFLADGVRVRGLAGISTLVPQDAAGFDASVRFNVSLGRECRDDEIQEAIRLAAFDEVVGSLQGGLDAPVGEGGGNLSGGQLQRLALARGLLAARSSSILLFDEPSAALDPATEDAVITSLLDARPDAAVVVSLHRLHFLPRFDSVVLLDQGRVQDQGTFEEVFERQSLLRGLCAVGTTGGN